MDTDRYCTTLDQLDRAEAIQAIHAAWLQLRACDQLGTDADNGPVIARLEACLRAAGHLGFDSMNELALIIVNDPGDYQDRLAIARLPDPEARRALWADRVRRETALQWIQFGKRFSPAAVDRAVEELETYYQQHIADLP